MNNPRFSPEFKEETVKDPLINSVMPLREPGAAYGKALCGKALEGGGAGA